MTAAEPGPAARGVALVTGASSGIGRATALALARAGWTTWGAARARSRLEALESHGITPVVLDLTDESSLEAAVAEIEAAQGAVDVLVNAAGYSEMGALEEVSPERLRRQFQTNVFGQLRLVQLVLPAMRRRARGRIVNVSSMGGEFTVPFGGAYHASKHALESLSDALRFELAPFGIAVIVVQPGVVATPLGRSTLAGLEPRPGSPYADALRRYYEFLRQNAGAALSPEDVARVIVAALEAEHPASRYRVGPEAEELPDLRRRLSDEQWDEMYRKLLDAL